MDKVKNTPKIDSLRLRIPMDEVKLNSDELGKEFEEYSLNTETGEMTLTKDKTTRNRIYHDTGTGIKHFYSIQNQPDLNNSRKPHIVIGVPSKILRDEYLTGIGKSTIDRVYEELIKENHINFSYESLLQAQVTDIDICKDSYMDSDTFNQFERYSKQNTIKTDKLQQGYKNYPPGRGIKTGFQFNVREYKNLPHFKSYDKEKELTTDKESKLFKENHLPPNIDIQNLKRVETNIKDKVKLKQWYGVETNTIETLISLPPKQMLGIIKKGYSKNIIENRRYREKTKGIQPMEYPIIALIETNENAPLNIIIDRVIEPMKQDGKSKNTITNYKKMIIKHFKNYHSDRVKNNMDIDEIHLLQNAFNKFGFNDI